MGAPTKKTAQDPVSEVGRVAAADCLMGGGLLQAYRKKLEAIPE